MTGLDHDALRSSSRNGIHIPPRTVLALLDEVDALKAEVERLKRLHAGQADHISGLRREYDTARKEAAQRAESVIVLERALAKALEEVMEYARMRAAPVAEIERLRAALASSRQAREADEDQFCEVEAERDRLAEGVRALAVSMRGNYAPGDYAKVRTRLRALLDGEGES